MSENFIFPSIKQAVQLQTAPNISHIKTLLNRWSRKSQFFSHQIGWRFSLSEKKEKLYIYCKSCSARLHYINRGTPQVADYELLQFSLHHNHPGNKTGTHEMTKRNQTGDLAALQKIQKYGQHISIHKKPSYRTAEDLKLMRLQFYFRLGLASKGKIEKHELTAFTAAKLNLRQRQLESFLSQTSRNKYEIELIKTLLKHAKFQKYQLDGQEGKSTRQLQQKGFENKKNMVHPLDSLYAPIILLINYNQKARETIHKTHLIELTYIKNILYNSRKGAEYRKYDILVLHGSDKTYQNNRLYAVIAVQNIKNNQKNQVGSVMSGRRTKIQKLKSALKVTLKLINSSEAPLNLIVNQQNEELVDALNGLLNEELQVLQIMKCRADCKKVISTSQSQRSTNFSYFYSRTLSHRFIENSQELPTFLKKYLLQIFSRKTQHPIDHYFKEAARLVQKKLQKQPIKKNKALEKLHWLISAFQKMGYGNTPTFFSFFHFAANKNSPMSLHEKLIKKIKEQYSGDSKNFLQLLLMLFDLFNCEEGSVLQKKETQTALTEVQKQFLQRIKLPEHKIIDLIKKSIREHAQKSAIANKSFEVEFPTPGFLRENTDKRNVNNNRQTQSTVVSDKRYIVTYYEQFCALLYEGVYQIKELFLKLSSQAWAFIIKQIQKSFTLQIQSKSLQKLEREGQIRLREPSEQCSTRKRKKNIYIVYLKDPKQFTLHSVQEVSEQTVSKNQKIGLRSNGDQKVAKRRFFECSCRLFEITYLPCSHILRCCISYFHSFLNEVGDFWIANEEKEYQEQLGFFTRAEKNRVLIGQQNAREGCNSEEEIQNSEQQRVEK